MVANGVTFTDDPVTAPTPGVIVTAGDPVTAQLNVLEYPSSTFAGVATKLVIVGASATTTLTEAVVLPNVFVAVSV